MRDAPTGQLKTFTRPVGRLSIIISSHIVLRRIDAAEVDTVQRRWSSQEAERILSVNCRDFLLKIAKEMRNKADELEERVDTIIGKKRKAKELEQEDEEVKASECASRRVSADFFPLLI